MGSPAPSHLVFGTLRFRIKMGFLSKIFYKYYCMILILPDLQTKHISDTGMQNIQLVLLALQLYVESKGTMKELLTIK